MTFSKTTVGLMAAALVLWGASGASAAGYTPASGSPLTLHSHPRLFIVADGTGSVGVTLSQLRERLRTTHRAAFQLYIDALDARLAIVPATKGQGDVISDGVGYALLSLVDPASLSFSVSRTTSQYAALAREHALLIAPVLSAGQGDTDDLEQITAGRGPTTLGASLIYDWTVNRGIWSDTDKQTLANAFIAAHDARMATARWRAQFSMSEGNPDRTHRGQLGALAMWGETIPGVALTGRDFQSEMQRLLDNLMSDWDDYLFPAFRFLLRNESGWPEGPVYDKEGFNSTSLAAGVLSTALNHDYFATEGFLREWPVWMASTVRPTMFPTGERGMMKMDTTGVRTTATFPDYGLTLHCLAATLAASNPDLSSMSRWMIEKLDLAPRTSDLYVRGYWWLWRFIWGYEHLPAARSPQDVGLQNSQRQGQLYTFRSGYGSDSDTLIAFLANENPTNVGGHAAIDNGSFIIEKFGNLVPQGGNRKGGVDTPDASSQLDFGLIGVYKPGELTTESQSRANYMGMDYQDSVKTLNPECAVEKCGAGRIASEALNRPGFDYVSFDYSRSWNPAKVTRAIRDFLYLRPEVSGAGEYVLVLDRVSAAAPEYQKRWHIKVPFDVEAIGGAWTTKELGVPVVRDGAVQGGVWEAPGSTVLRMVNRYAAANGALFVKSIFPTSSTIRKIGGDTYEFRDAEMTNYNINTRQYLTDDAADVMGRYRLEIIPRTAQRDDLFLTALQFGNADSLRGMSQVRPLTTDSGNMKGAQVLDPKRTRVVLFSGDFLGAPVVGDVQYSYVSASSVVSHLLVNLPPSTTYYMVQTPITGGARVLLSVTAISGGTAISSDAAGTLSFTAPVASVVDAPLAEGQPIGIKSPWSPPAGSDPGRPRPPYNVRIVR